jgi:hypothetical protein
MKKAEAKKNTVEPQVPEPPTSETDLVKFRDKRASDALAAIQVASSLSTSGYSDEESVVLKKGSVSRYREFAPADPTESLLVILSVGLQNAAMTSLDYAARAEMPEARSEEMRNATGAAGIVVELLEALDRHRRRSNQSVTVGQRRKNWRSGYCRQRELRRQAQHQARGDGEPERRPTARQIMESPLDC